MKIRTTKILILTLIAIILLCIQTSLFKFLVRIPTSPNLLIILVVVLGFINGERLGLIIGLISGLLLDFVSGGYVGLYALVFMFIGYFSGKLKRIYVEDNLTIIIMLLFISDIIFNIIIYIFTYLPRQRYLFLNYSIYVILPEIILTIIFGILLYKPLKILSNKLS